MVALFFILMGILVPATIFYSKKIRDNHLAEKKNQIEKTVVQTDKQGVTLSPHNESKKPALVLSLSVLALLSVLGIMIWRQQLYHYRLLNKAESDKQALMKHFEYILKFANDLIFLINKDLTIIEVNDKVIEHYGYSRKELIGMKVSDYRSPQAVSSIKTDYDTLTEKKSLTFETIHRRKDGSEFPIEMSARVMEIEGEMYFQTIGRDITERRRQEEKLNNLLQRFNLAISAANMGVWDWDFVNNNLIWDDKVTELYGRDKDSITYGVEEWIKSVHPDDVENARAEVRNALKELKDYKSEYRILLPDNSIRFIKSFGRILRDAQGNPLRMTGVAYDITEQRNALDLIKEREFWLTESQRVGRLGSYSLDIKTNIWSTSEVLDDILGLKKDIKKSIQTWQEIIHPDFKEKMQSYADSEIIGQARPFDKEFKIIKPDTGEERWVLGRGEMLRDSNNKPVFMIGTIQDITERKHAEEDLIRAKEKAEESDRLKTAFLHNISHEIRTPLNAIVGFTTLLDTPDLDTDIKGQYMDIIFQSSDQLLSIITDIVDISNIEVGHVKLSIGIVNINSLIKNLFDQHNLRALQQGLKLKYSVNLEDDVALVLTDGTKLIQVLTNLLNNAIKFTKTGSVEFGYNLIEGDIEFFVKDTGIGIEEDKFQKIFERFYQVENTHSKQYSGTGLGLSISKAYVELMGGKIWLSSELEKGTTFYFTIPYNSAEKRQSIIKPNSEKKMGKTTGKTILVAEDDRINFLLIRETLARTGINILWAVNGEEAVDFCRKNENIDLILMDIKMPLMNGYEALKIIKEFRPALPVVALTAYASLSDRERALSEGCADHIAKPIDRTQLFNTLQQFL